MFAPMCDRFAYHIMYPENLFFRIVNASPIETIVKRVLLVCDHSIPFLHLFFLTANIIVPYQPYCYLHDALTN